MKPKEVLNKVIRHREWGLVEVIEVPYKAKSTVIAKVVQRGRGWDPHSQTYRPYCQAYLNSDGSRTLTWRTTKRDEYGITDTINLKDCSWN